MIRTKIFKRTLCYYLMKKLIYLFSNYFFQDFMVDLSLFYQHQNEQNIRTLIIIHIALQIALRRIVVMIICLLESNKYETLKNKQLYANTLPDLILIPFNANNNSNEKEQKNQTIIIHKIYLLPIRNKLEKMKQQAHLLIIKRKWFQFVAENEIEKHSRWTQIIVRMLFITDIRAKCKVFSEQIVFSRRQVQKIIFAAQNFLKSNINTPNELRVAVQQNKQLNRFKDFTNTLNFYEILIEYTPQLMIKENDRLLIKLQQEVKKEMKRSVSQSMVGSFLADSKWIQRLSQNFLYKQCIWMLIDYDLVSYFNARDRSSIINRIISAYEELKMENKSSFWGSLDKTKKDLFFEWISRRKTITVQQKWLQRDQIKQIISM